MLAPVRSSLPRASRSLVARSSVAQVRTIVTKEERWSASDVRALSAGPAPTLDLKQVVPNIEARWAKLSKEEQFGIYRALEELQKKDWKELSLDEKKAAYFVSFGPHGPRKPITLPGQGVRTAAGVVGLVVATVGVFYGLRNFAQGPPKTMTPEWQEQTNEYLKEQKSNPITGISSDNYKGKGHVQGSFV